MKDSRFSTSSKVWAAAALLAAVCTTLPARSAAAAGLLIADGGFGGQLEIKEQDVRVTINNGVAVTEIEQVFLNKEQRVVEALYTFPVPKEASVSNFSMWIGGKEMIGEVVEKQRARQIYESYKQVRRDPGLLEQVDYKRFEMRIFPIAAGAEQRVRITYYQELDFDHDRASYVYPLDTVTQPTADQRTTGRFSFAIDVKSEVPITELNSPSHADQFVVVKHANANYWQASYETDGGELSRDLVINYSVERPRTGIDLITSKSADEDGYFQLTLTAGQELEAQTGGSDYVFVVDVSGSMRLDGKLALSREAVNAFVQSLGESDRFEVIAFNIAADPLFNAPTQVTAETKTRAADFLRSQKAMGGTILNPAIEAAYRYRGADRQLNVVVLSDGMTEQSEQRQLLDLISRRPEGVSVFCVGIGNEVNRPLLGQLAQETGGLAAFLSNSANFEQEAQAFRRKLTRPAATNVRIAIEGVEVYDVEPPVLPNLFHGQPVRMYGRYKQSGEAKVTVKAEVLGSPLEQSIPVTLPARDEANPEIERMWALHRVSRLMGQDRKSGSIDQVGEIVRLCEAYSIVSPFASFIVLENDAEYQRWKIERRNATRIQRDRTAQAAVRERLEELRRETAQQVGPQRNSEVAKQSTPQRSDARPATADQAATPANEPNLPPSVDQPLRQNAPASRPRSRDLVIDFPSGGRSGGGGGAIDPLTALFAAGLAGSGWLARKRRNTATS
jgi:Ca-activated chloride channel family protein